MSLVDAVMRRPGGCGAYGGPISAIDEVVQLVQELQGVAWAQGLAICGGGTHVAQFWNERVLTPSDALMLRSPFQERINAGFAALRSAAAGA